MNTTAMSRTRVSVVAGIAVALLIGIWVVRGLAQLPQNAIQTLAPADGSTFVSGETISVSVQPAQGVAFDVVDVYSSALGAAQTSLGPPYEVSLQIPEAFLGDADVFVWAVTGDGRAVTRRLTLHIEAPGGAQLETLVVPLLITLREMGEVKLLRVYGQYSDGVQRELGGEKLEWSPTDARVVKAGATGVLGYIQASDYGATNVVVRSGSLSGQIRVEVGRFERRGDLNGDGTVDERDADIVKGAIGRSANSEDPRDLNGDGIIDERDLDVLKGLL